MFSANLCEAVTNGEGKWPLRGDCFAKTFRSLRHILVKWSGNITFALMACYNGEIGIKFPSGRWEEFCKDRAEVAARQFANEFLQFLGDNPVYDVSGASTTFSKRFVEYFLQSFDNEVHKNGFMDFDAPDSPTDVFGPDDWGSSIQLTGTFKPIEKKSNESSFRFLGKLKDVFKRSVDEPSGVAKHAEARRETEDRAMLHEAKLPTTIKREGVMNYLMNLESGVNTEDFFWQKCRVVLFKAPGGYMLEFYTPPKVRKVRFLKDSFSHVKMRTDSHRDCSKSF